LTKRKPAGYWKEKQGLERAVKVILELADKLEHTPRHKDTPKGITKAILLGHWEEFGIYRFSDLIEHCGLKTYKKDTMRTLEEFPALLEQWHPAKNGDLDPLTISIWYKEKVWWKCPEWYDHEWEAFIGNRVRRGDGCSCCAGRQLSETNSLQALYPDIAAEWHPTKNGDLTPDKILAGTHKKVWWKCPEGDDHEWEALVNSRTSQGTGCPCCSGDAVCDSNRFSTLYPKIAAEWHSTENKDKKPEDYTYGSGEEVWWKCPEGDDHEWEMQICSRVGGSGCPYCALKEICKTNTLSSLHPDIAAEWHSTKNEDLTPKDIMPNYKENVWWKCPEGDDHEWEATPYSRTKRGSGCYACLGKQLSDTNRFAILKPGLLEQWDYERNKGLDPYNFKIGSHEKVWWICSKNPKHFWKASISTRVRGRGCHACSGRKVADDNSLVVLYPVVAAEWHSTRNGELNPEDYTYGSKEKVWWKCSKNPDHEWEAQITNRTRLGRGCPDCANYGYWLGSKGLERAKKEIQDFIKKNGRVPTSKDVSAGIIYALSHNYWNIKSWLELLESMGLVANKGMYDYLWKRWEDWVLKVVMSIYPEEAQIYPRLPNNKRPEFILRLDGKTIIGDAKLNANSSNIAVDIENYLPYCDILEFWCLYRVDNLHIDEENVRFLNPSNILDRVANVSLRKELNLELEKIRNYKEESFPYWQTTLDDFV